MIDRRTLLEDSLSLEVMTIPSWIGYHVTGELLSVAI